MPLTGFNWARFADHLKKYNVVYIIGIIICIFLTNVVYTATAPRVPEEEEVLLYLVTHYAETEQLEPLEEEALAYGQTVDETLKLVHYETIMYNDPEQDPNSAMVLVARMSGGDADVYFANATATETIIGYEAFEPLDEYLANGWMEGLDLEPVYATNAETGEQVIAALSLDNVSALLDIGSFDNRGANLIIAGYGSNTETTLEVTEYMIRRLMEGYTYDASAQSEE